MPAADGIFRGTCGADAPATTVSPLEWHFSNNDSSSLPPQKNLFHLEVGEVTRGGRMVRVRTLYRIERGWYFDINLISKKKEIGQKMRSFHTPSRVSNALDEKKRRPAATRVEGRSYLNELSSRTYATNYGGEEGKLRIKYEFTTYSRLKKER